MSFDIAPVGRTPSTAPAATDQTHNTAPTNATQASDSVTVDTIPSSPPPEVHEAMGIAAQAYDNLQAQGQQLRFKVNPQIFSHGWELPARLTGEGGRSGRGIPVDARSNPGEQGARRGQRRESGRLGPAAKPGRLGADYNR